MKRGYLKDMLRIINHSTTKMKHQPTIQGDPVGDSLPFIEGFLFGIYNWTYPD